MRIKEQETHLTLQEHDDDDEVSVNVYTQRLKIIHSVHKLAATIMWIVRLVQS